MDLLIKTAGGNIKCLRCMAMSKRTKVQCGRPALRSSNKQKCQFHGGRSSGPKTDKGRASIARAHLVHGNETKEKRLDRSKKALWFAHIEDVMHVLGMTTAPRQSGRKPSGYKEMKTIDEVKNFIEFDKSLA